MWECIIALYKSDFKSTKGFLSSKKAEFLGVLRLNVIKALDCAGVQDILVNYELRLEPLNPPIFIFMS